MKFQILSTTMHIFAWQKNMLERLKRIDIGPNPSQITQAEACRFLIDKSNITW